MSKSIAMTENPAITATPLLPHIQLINLHQVAFSSARFPIFEEKQSYDQPFYPTQSIEISMSKKDKEVLAIVKVGVSSGKDKLKLMEAKAIYRVVYKIKDTYKGDLIMERAEAFCRAHTLAHVWPYWREALASACTRMQIPPIIAPLLVVGSQSSRILDDASSPKPAVPSRRGQSRRKD